jgi:hypothetical protein
MPGGGDAQVPNFRNAPLQQVLSDNRSVTLFGIALIAKQHRRCLQSDSGGNVKGLLPIIRSNMTPIDIEEPLIVPTLHGISAIFGVTKSLQVGVSDSDIAQGIGKFSFRKTPLARDRDVAHIDEMLHAC